MNDKFQKHQRHRDMLSRIWIDYFLGQTLPNQVRDKSKRRWLILTITIIAISFSIDLFWITTTLSIAAVIALYCYYQNSLENLARQRIRANNKYFIEKEVFAANYEFENAANQKLPTFNIDRLINYVHSKLPSTEALTQTLQLESIFRSEEALNSIPGISCSSSFKFSVQAYKELDSITCFITGYYQFENGQKIDLGRFYIYL